MEAKSDATVYTDSKTGAFLDRGDHPNYISGDGVREYWLKGPLDSPVFAARKGNAANLMELRDGMSVHAWVRGPPVAPQFFNSRHGQTLAVNYWKDGYWTQAWVQGVYHDPTYLIRKRGRPNWIDSRGVAEWRVGKYFAPLYAERYEKPAAVDTARGLRMYATNGKHIGALPIRYRVPWSACSRHAKLQLGGTCASAAVLNLFLNTPLLRNACISRTLQLFETFPHLESVWRTGDLRNSEGDFHLVLLQTVYSELCARRGKRVPTDVSFASHCMFSSLLANLGKGLSRYIRSPSLVMDLMNAAGFDHVFFNIPELALDDAVLTLPDPSKTYFVYTRIIDGHGEVFEEATPQFQKGPLSVIGSIIQFLKLADDPPGQAGQTGHAVAGLLCGGGGGGDGDGDGDGSSTPLIFDSNIGEVSVDWMQGAASFHAAMTHVYGELAFIHQVLLYVTIDVHDAAARRPFAAACESVSAKRTQIQDAPFHMHTLTRVQRLRLYNALDKSEPAEFYFGEE